MVVFLVIVKYKPIQVMPQKPKDKMIQLKKGNLKKETMTKHSRKKTRATPIYCKYPLQHRTRQVL